LQKAQGGKRLTTEGLLLPLSLQLLLGPPSSEATNSSPGSLNVYTIDVWDGYVFIGATPNQAGCLEALLTRCQQHLLLICGTMKNVSKHAKCPLKRRDEMSSTDVTYNLLEE
jgi:hypothetical protein